MPHHRAEVQPNASAREVVWHGGIWIFTFCLLMAGVQWLQSPGAWPLISVSMLGAVLMLAVLALTRSRRWRLAAQCFIWGAWLLTLAATVVAGDTHTGDARAYAQQIPLLIYPLLVVLAAWVEGARTTKLLLAATVLSLGGLWLAGALGLGWFGPRPGLSVGTLLCLFGILGLTAAVTLLARDNLARSAVAARRAMDALQRNQDDLRKFYRTVEQNPESIVITDTRLDIVYVNDAFVVRSGYAREDVLGRPSRQFSTMGMTEEQRADARRCLEHGGVWRGQMSNVARSGESLQESVLLAPIRNTAGQLVNYVEIKRDLTEQLSAKQHIHQLSHFDPLTGLPNRSQLLHRLHALCAGSGDGDMRHGLLLIDMDRFTAFNDVHGNGQGDALIRALGERLRDSLPSEAFVARMAADEFAVVVQDLGRDAAFAESAIRGLALGLQNALRRPFWLESMAREFGITGCVGGALFTASGKAGADSDALRQASVALHQAKQSGQGVALMFEPGMAEAADQRFHIESDLRHAIPAGELQLYLQTQANRKDHCIGAEVLVRWQHPRLGLLTPSIFIPVAEQSNLIVLLGDWVLRQACRQLARPEFVRHGLRLSVNVSAQQFGQADFVTKVRRILRETGADPSRLTLEITERVVMHDMAEAMGRMLQLRELGIEFALDDFGTGYSSLAYLKNLPLQELKIDKSFIRDSRNRERDQAMVKAILVLASRMQLRVVAEGVETPEQARLLASWNRGIVFQGYHYGRPLPVEEWLTLVTSDIPSGDNRWSAKVEEATMPMPLSEHI